MIRTELETDRLKLRLFTSDDVQITYELGTDPEIIRYAESEPLKNLEEARQRLKDGPWPTMKSTATDVLQSSSRRQARLSVFAGSSI